MTRIGPTASHALLSVPLFAAGLGASAMGSHWAGALAVMLYWLGRELAQSLRPSTMRLVWTWTHTRNFGVPAALALAAASAIEIAKDLTP